MKNFEFKPLAIFLALLFTCSFYTLTAQDSENAAVTALQSFEHLIGVKWHIEGSYQVFEWGVGKKSVQSRSYF
ncbi:MAG: hypothetical protein KJP00_09345, partial [Bacteroidia bacterium]|nr:hypothetical protein [Bacteroidia bacterium]